MIELAISSWTLHGALGAPWYETDADGNRVNFAEELPAQLSLLELPAFIAADGFKLLEICNFHMPSLEDEYLAQLREAIAEAGVTLVNFLIDTGNLSEADPREWNHEVVLAKRWQDIAVKLGAQGVRLDCGTEEPDADAMRRSADALHVLSDYGASVGLHTTTENWRETSAQSDKLLRILDGVGKPIKLCLDFGNAAKTPDKYATMRALLPRATSLHCKGIFDGDALDVEEFQYALSLVRDADFSGHVALICDGIEDEWDKVLTLKGHVERELMQAG